MDELQLPLLRPGDTIQRAMDDMQSTNARAIIVGPLKSDDGSYVLQMNAAVMKGYAEKRVRLRDLDPGIPLPDLSRHPLVQRKGNYGYHDYGIEMESLLDSRKVSYALTETRQAGPAGVNIVTITTREERLAARIRSANKVCVCDGPDRHTGDAPPLRNGEQCNECEHKYICR